MIDKYSKFIDLTIDKFIELGHTRDEALKFTLDIMREVDRLHEEEKAMAEESNDRGSESDQRADAGEYYDG